MMLPKDRLHMALDHTEPDAVPLDIGALTTTSIVLEAHENLLKEMHMPTRDLKIRYPTLRVADVSDELAEQLKVDVRGVGPRWSDGSVLYGEDGAQITLLDEWGIVWRRKNCRGSMFYPTSGPLSEATTVRGIEEYKSPDPKADFRFQALRAEAKKLWQSGYALAMNHWIPGLLEMAGFLRGHKQVFLDMARKSPLLEALLDKILELKLAFWESAIAECGEFLSVVKQNDDLGAQAGLLISPEHYRAYIKPRHRVLFNHIKKLTGDKVKLLFHSCGAISELIPDFIEIGVDVLNPVQISAKDMSASALKARFGKEISFWGAGIDPAILTGGDPATITDHVTRQVEQLAPGGGFVFASINTITPEASGKNILMMWEAFQECKAYG